MTRRPRRRSEAQPRAERRTQAERSAATRAALLTAARRLFAERGYAATGREQIVAAAGVTRGALYHHFTGKEDLFRAVYEQLEAEIVARVVEAAATAGHPLDQLRVRRPRLSRRRRPPDVQRVMLLDAPSVLDWETRREIVEAHVLGLVRAGLQAAMDAGLLEPQPVVPLAHVLLAALHEAALYVARAIGCRRRGRRGRGHPRPPPRRAPQQGRSSGQETASPSS